MRLAQVVPRFEPQAEGVSAYACCLATALEPARSGDVRYVTGHDLRLESAARTLDEVASPGRCDLILLHYVGYGYQSRGVAWELARSWERLRRFSTPDGPRLGVVFHEVAAFGPPWRSSFWLRPLQRSVARRILGASDLAVTTVERYRDLLRSLDATRPVEVVGIPSTIGEPDEVPELSGREDRLVVFGSSGVRARAWGTYRADLAAAARALGTREIVDVGVDVGAPDRLEGIPVVRRGVSEAAAISELLGRARGGFLAYPPDFLGKSTVFAAYAAHGVVPVCAWRGRGARAPGSDDPWVTADGIRDPSEVAHRALAHYATRNLSRHAGIWHQLMEPQ